MSLRQAQATGFVGPEDESMASECRMYQGLKGVDALWVDKTQKVVEIALGPALRTDKGTRVSDSYREVHHEYPDVTEGFNGMASAVAPGAPVKAQYVFSFIGPTADDHLYPEDRVTSISLAAAGAACHN